MWEEISAALGQTALLTKIIIEKAQFTIEKYTIHPLGSRSFIMEKNGTRIWAEKNYSHEFFDSVKITIMVVCSRNMASLTKF